MMTTRRATSAILCAMAMLTLGGISSAAEVASGLHDANTASASDLQSLPNMTPAIANALLAKRPFKTVVDLNVFLLEQKLTQEQASAFYRRAFVKINLNTGTRDEFLLIPGVATRMAHEFEEYRPWKTWAQFDKEIGKYVGQQETDRLKQFVFIPPS